MSIGTRVLARVLPEVFGIGLHAYLLPYASMFVNFDSFLWQPLGFLSWALYHVRLQRLASDAYFENGLRHLLLEACAMHIKSFGARVGASVPNAHQLTINYTIDDLNKLLEAVS